MSLSMRIIASVLPSLLWAGGTAAGPLYVFSTGDPDGKMAMASRPASAGKFEIETADDFALAQPTSLSSATFTGLLSGQGVVAVNGVRIEIYRVFPLDSNVGRTSGPPTFSTSSVPTRVNSPSDVALDDRDSAPPPTLNFSTTLLTNDFTAANSIRPGGIHATPNQTTGGNGPVTGQEVRFDVTFATPFDLAAGHYFFVPQVEMSDPAGDFYWLSAPRPIVAPGTPFPPGDPDLQVWTRDETLAPDWLRVGTDIVGGAPAPAFNAVFSLTGQTVPEPDTLALTGLAALALAAVRRRPAA